MELICRYPCRISYIVMIGLVLRLLGYTRNSMLLMDWEMVGLYLPSTILSLEHITLARQWHIVTKLQLWVPLLSLLLTCYVVRSLHIFPSCSCLSYLNCFGYSFQVSDTYSKEVAGHGAIAPHYFKFHGIRNGIDPDIWDPYTDNFIPVHSQSASVHILLICIYTFTNCLELKVCVKSASLATIFFYFIVEQPIYLQLCGAKQSYCS